MPFGAVSRTDLSLTTGLSTSSLSAWSSAEGQTIAWRVSAEVTTSRTARSAGSARPPARAWPCYHAKQPCWLPRAVGQASADARARPADERSTADAKRAGRKPGASCAAALDNTGRPRRARCGPGGSQRCGHNPLDFDGHSEVANGFVSVPRYSLTGRPRPGPVVPLRSHFLHMAAHLSDGRGRNRAR